MQGNGNKNYLSRNMMIQIIGRGMVPIHCEHKADVFLLIRRILQRAEQLQVEGLLEGMEWVTTLNGRIVRKVLKGRTFTTYKKTEHVVPDRYRLKFIESRRFQKNK